MSDGNKKQRHQFLEYLEDYQDIAVARDVEEQEEREWVSESQGNLRHRQRFAIWIYGLSAVFLLVVIGFWWNISRAQFYQALDKPLADNKFQEFLLLVDEAKNSGQETNVDWRASLNEIDEESLSVEEQQVLSELKQKVNNGADLGDLINEIK
ncbi:MAG TPA: hypothetical protein PLB38_02565 [bacterium]|nr:hypothetical protein [bacterium]